MLQFENIYFKYSKKAGSNILKNISFSAAPGKICAIIGPNGSGKSTLLKCAAGVINPCDGKIFYKNECLTDDNLTNRAGITAYMPQTQNPPSCTVFDAVLLGRKPHINFRPSKKDIMKTEKTIHTADIGGIAMKRCNELSGGELQKTILARCIAQEPQILLLDEPTNHLDLKNQIEVMKLIKKLTEKFNIITVAVIHDINLAIRFGNDFVLIKNGEIFARSDKSVINKENIDFLYSVNCKILNMQNEKIVFIE